MRADVRSRALGYYRSGAVTILAAASVPGQRRPYYVEAHVDGHRSARIVRLDAGAWSCTCRQDGCAHVAAVQLATGWPSAASPATPTSKES